VFDSTEALFLSRSNEAAVLQQRRGGIVEVTRNAEDVH
jgi:hypothetical protein